MQLLSTLIPLALATQVSNTPLNPIISINGVSPISPRCPQSPRRPHPSHSPMGSRGYPRRRESTPKRHHPRSARPPARTKPKLRPRLPPGAAYLPYLGQAGLFPSRRKVRLPGPSGRYPLFGEWGDGAAQGYTDVARY